MRPEHEEELEVLQSIYEGDSNFSVVNNNTFQYKMNVPIDPSLLKYSGGKAILMRHLLREVKDKIKCGLEEQAENNLGMSMTFTLFEWLKEAREDLIKDQPTEASVTIFSSEVTNGIDNLDIQENSDKKKKEHLTKSQKRKMWDRQNAEGERARGYDWVDIVKHLSQTGKSTT
ncbi:RWD domain-containing protein 4 [Armadillidium nasatum]|uniref:RWD domain-containing protein 4 n=1 Tax=Armadillidium nasatum TaxID=96803 RepID=A0A5N5SJR5_9CRUS|nr:RWD domain-containing protein 4 [Armadillidium nasatum]